MAKPKRNLLLIFIVLTYAISIFMALKIYKGKNDNHEIKPIYNIYLLNNDKTKYDKITKSDLISIDVSKIYDLNENGMINDKNQIIKDSNIFFESNELDKLLEKDIYISNEFSKNSILHKDKLMSYEDVIKKDLKIIFVYANIGRPLLEEEIEIEEIIETKPPKPEPIPEPEPEKEKKLRKAKKKKPGKLLKSSLINKNESLGVKQEIPGVKKKEMSSSSIGISKDFNPKGKDKLTSSYNAGIAGKKSSFMS